MKTQNSVSTTCLHGSKRGRTITFFSRLQIIFTCCGGDSKFLIPQHLYQLLPNMYDLPSSHPCPILLSVIFIKRIPLLNPSMALHCPQDKIHTSYQGPCLGLCFHLLLRFYSCSSSYNNIPTANYSFVPLHMLLSPPTLLPHPSHLLNILPWPFSI